jgi:hypothetical protein
MGTQVTEKTDTDPGFVNFHPQVVREQIQVIERIYGGMEGALEAFPGVDSYIRRLYNTRSAMQDEDNWAE